LAPVLSVSGFIAKSAVIWMRKDFCMNLSGSYPWAVSSHLADYSSSSHPFSGPPNDMHRPLFLTSLGSFAAGLACWWLYRWNGSYVDQDGVLHEQFGFIPLGWLFDLLGLVLLVLAWVRRK
jgi:hypothetical protein